MVRVVLVPSFPSSTENGVSIFVSRPSTEVEPLSPLSEHAEIARKDIKISIVENIWVTAGIEIIHDSKNYLRDSTDYFKIFYTDEIKVEITFFFALISNYLQIFNVKNRLYFNQY